MNKHDESTNLTKEKVMNSARSLFSKKGYTATSISDIIKMSNVSKGNLYYHYENKESIFINLIKQDTDVFIRKWKRQELHSKTPKEKIYALVQMINDSTVNYIPDHIVNEFLQNNRETNQPYSKEIETLNDEVLSIIKDILIEGKVKFNWKVLNENDGAFIIASFLTGLAVTIINLNEVDRERVITETANFILSGVHGI